MPLHRPFLALLCILALSGCQTPDRIQSPQTPQSSELMTALQHLEDKQYQTAEALLKAALNTGNELTSQQALAGLSLLHLQNQNINLATTSLDELYQRALRKPQDDPSLKILRLSLTLGLENSLRLAIERKNRADAETKQLQLHNEAESLQRALEKLRQLTLQ